MALNPGDIHFIAYFSDSDSGATGSDLFRVVVTRDIAAGEEIDFVVFNSGNSFQGGTIWTYEAPVGGLSAFDKLTFTEVSTNVISVSNSSATNGDGTITQQPTSDGPSGGFNLADTYNLTALSDGEVIAGINPGVAYTYPPSTVTAAGGGTQVISTTDMDAYLLTSPDPSPILNAISSNDPDNEDNGIYTGSTIEGIDDPSQWEFSDTNVSYATGDVGGDGTGSNFASQNADIACFAPGTLIATPMGEVPVETLCIGDTVLTAEGNLVPVRWVGRQTIVKAIAGPRAQLVRIQTGVLGNHSDLYVTCDHGMVVDGVIVNAGALLNGAGIDLVPFGDTPEWQTVYHIETPAHEVVLANGAPSETYLDLSGRRNFDNLCDYPRRGLADHPTRQNPLPRVSCQRLLPSHLRQRFGIMTDDGSLDDWSLTA